MDKPELRAIRFHLFAASACIYGRAHSGALSTDCTLLFRARTFHDVQQVQTGVHAL